MAELSTQERTDRAKTEQGDELTHVADPRSKLNTMTYDSILGTNSEQAALGNARVPDADRERIISEIGADSPLARHLQETGSFVGFKPEPGERIGSGHLGTMPGSDLRETRLGRKVSAVGAVVSGSVLDGVKVSQGLGRVGGTISDVYHAVHDGLDRVPLVGPILNTFGEAARTVPQAIKAEVGDRVGRINTPGKHTAIGADFSDSALINGTDLSGLKSFKNASFRNAWIGHDTKLRRVNMEGTDLRGIKFIGKDGRVYTTSQLIQRIGYKDTKKMIKSIFNGTRWNTGSTMMDPELQEIFNDLSVEVKPGKPGDIKSFSDLKDVLDDSPYFAGGKFDPKNKSYRVDISNDDKSATVEIIESVDPFGRGAACIIRCSGFHDEELKERLKRKGFDLSEADGDPSTRNIHSATFSFDDGIIVATEAIREAQRQIHGKTDMVMEVNASADLPPAPKPDSDGPEGGATRPEGGRPELGVHPRPTPTPDGGSPAPTPGGRPTLGVIDGTAPEGSRTSPDETRSMLSEPQREAPRRVLPEELESIAAASIEKFGGLNALTVIEPKPGQPEAEVRPMQNNHAQTVFDPELFHPARKDELAQHLEDLGLTPDKPVVIMTPVEVNVPSIVPVVASNAISQVPGYEKTPVFYTMLPTQPVEGPEEA